MTALTVAPAAYTVNSFCEAFGIGRTKLYELIGSGAIRALKLGSKTLIPASEGVRFLESLPAIETGK
jgi:excisionase family DNA binding protein